MQSFTESATDIVQPTITKTLIEEVEGARRRGTRVKAEVEEE
jgi:hypothetical protein